MVTDETKTSLQTTTSRVRHQDGTFVMQWLAGKAGIDRRQAGG